LKSIRLKPNYRYGGWFLSFAHAPEDIQFLLNGKPFASVEWPLPTPNLVEYFGCIPGADQASFVCRQPTTDLRELFPGGYARLSVADRQGEHRRSYRTAWFCPDPSSPVPVPDGARIARVIGSAHTQNFLIGGATSIRRIDSFLRERFDRGIWSFSSILDWGCGCGRLTRHLIPEGNSTVTGADIDLDNIEWCRENLKFASFQHVGLQPPMPFADAQFDLVLGISVLTHLAEEDQFRWLSEVQRITKPGGLALLSIRGPAQMALSKPTSDQYLEIQRKGFVDSGLNHDLDAVLEEKEFYRCIDQSRDYIFAKWDKYFDVLEIVDAIASNQDLVVLRRRKTVRGIQTLRHLARTVLEMQWHRLRSTVTR
jgi:SAM-dependent methyltransferase